LEGHIRHWVGELFDLKEIDLSTFSPSSVFQFRGMRIDRDFRREAVRWAVLRILQGGLATLEDWLDWFSASFDYDNLGKADKANVSQNRWYIRRIATGWANLDEETQESFIAGRVVPSTLAVEIARQRKSFT